MVTRFQEFIFGGFQEPPDHTRFPKEVSQHQHPDEGDGGRDDEPREDGRHDGKEDADRLRDGPGLDHHDLAFCLGGEKAHDGGLDNGDKGHIGIGRDCHRA